ncbi:hypothetical protein SBP18_05720 [Rhodoferax ferrireducens]|uniref:hypothetical protein n=1 Tax=Rhodoferax ferrireducens TaxID=192843 RepID=UPI00298EB2AF|nr:hypothetical protein [Rhodoferax ferrireducens]WPC68011.1 hypothetical protein SBP18_05720 [Rhodoferax ferrireducens]
MTSPKRATNWIDRFPESPSDAFISSRVKIPAKPIIGLGVSSSDVDARQLEAGLKQVYFPTSNACDILRRFSSIGRAHALEYFPDTPSYVSGLYHDLAPSTNSLPICFTGLAGVGKTELVKAFERLIGTYPAFNIAGMEGIPNIAGWYMRVNERASISQLLLPILEPITSPVSEYSESSSGHKSPDIVRLLQRARRRAHRDGVCVAFADEFQFRTQSQDATALITKLLYQLWTLGPRLVFVSNYSLLHTLKRRPDQDRDRLLSSPMVLHPCSSRSDDWNKILEELFRVGPDVFRLNAAQDGEALHQFSFGVHRRLVDLLVLAYRMQRDMKKLTVSLADIERAQRCEEFSTHRETVNILIEQSITKKMVRPDLWCPFQSLPSNNVVHSDEMVDRFVRKVQNDQLRSSLTSEERGVVEAIEGPKHRSRTRANVVAIGRPKALTRETLLDGEACFDETL